MNNIMMFLLLIDDQDTRNYLEKLYEKYRFLCYKIARNIVKTTNDSEDVVQQTFMKVAEFLQDKGKESIKEEKAFIGKIATNIALNHLALNNKHAHNNFDTVEPINDTFIEPEVSVIRMDKIREHTQKLNQLNEGYAYIIMLKYGEELTISEIATLLNMTEDTTRKKVSRARIAYMNIVKEGELDV